ncbi:MAG: magnesium transporter [Phycisphaeraceae bacterium]|nr:magnesium transporter [Phycisphaerales bacterium]MCB9859946.1 magnesium transporter [Phycisphaeraceae bacterium]
MNPTAELLQPEIEELIRNKRFADLRSAIHALPYADLALIFAEIDPALAAVGFRLLPREDAAELFSYLDPEQQEALIGQFGNDHVREIFDELGADDLAYLLEEMPSDIARRIVNTISPETREAAQRLLGYPEESVGRLMTPDYIRLKIDWTVARALAHIRAYGRDAETINVVYIVDDHDKLVSDLKLRTLLLASPDAPLSDLQQNTPTSLFADDDREEAVRAMAKYDRIALPVVDHAGVLLGIVTSDDVADVAEEEATEDIQKLAGVEALDEPYMDTPLLSMLKKRGIVLCTLLVAQSVTIGVLGAFEHVISSVQILILFIPLIIASGGNSGTQVASLIIRALALHELTPADWLQVVRKELVTGLLLGCLMGALATCSVMIWELTPMVDATGVNPLKVGLTVGAAVQAIVVYAVLLGSILPLLLQKLKLDPATISSPLVATLMDVSGLMIYMGVALVMMKVVGLT